MRAFLLTFSVVLMLGVDGVRVTAAEKAAEKPADKPAATQPAPVNKKCPVSGEDVDAKGKTVQYKGKTVGFCCDKCLAKFAREPQKYAAKVTPDKK